MNKLLIVCVLLSGSAFADESLQTSETAEQEKVPECVCIDGKPNEESTRLRHENDRLKVENRIFRSLLVRAKILKK